MDAKIYLRNYAQSADKFLNSFFAQKKKAADKIDPRLGRMLDVFQNYTYGGKKIRGALTALGYQLAGGKDFGSILPVSCGIELLHNFLLIHDDIIDKDEVRRGKPTVHTLFSKKNGEHFGISKGIIAGDIGAFLGYELIVGSVFSKKRINEAFSKLNEYLLKTGYGQVLDIEFDFKKKVSWDDILKVRTYKTAYYTIIMPLTVGAILGGAKDKTLKAIERYGVSVGIAFQLTDDILGVFGKSDKTGKSNESDIREGKKTLLFVKALELAKGRERQFLLKWYGSDKLDKNKIEKIREIIKDSGSLDYSRKLAEEMTEKGKRFIPKITRNSEFREVLSSLADFMVYRSK